jgi:hypothetical protein
MGHELSLGAQRTRVFFSDRHFKLPTSTCKSARYTATSEPSPITIKLSRVLKLFTIKLLVQVRPVDRITV